MGVLASIVGVFVGGPLSDGVDVGGVSVGNRVGGRSVGNEVGDRLEMSVPEGISVWIGLLGLVGKSVGAILVGNIVGNRLDASVVVGKFVGDF